MKEEKGKGSINSLKKKVKMTLRTVEIEIVSVILDVSALSIFSSCQNLGVYKTTHHVATYRRRNMTNIIKFATELFLTCISSP
jgi:hypothetical protein